MATTETKMKKATKKIQKDIDCILTILNAEKDVLERISQAKKDAQGLLLEGYIIPGYKLKETFSNRAWNDNASTENLFKTFKKWIAKKSILTETKIISPAKLEKYFIEDDEAREKLADFIGPCTSRGFSLTKA